MCCDAQLLPDVVPGLTQWSEDAQQTEKSEFRPSSGRFQWCMQTATAVSKHSKKKKKKTHTQNLNSGAWERGWALTHSQRQCEQQLPIWHLEQQESYLPAEQELHQPHVASVCLCLLLTGSLSVELSQVEALFSLFQRWVVLFLPGGAALSFFPDSFTDCPLPFLRWKRLSLPLLLHIKPSHFSLTSSFLLLSLSLSLSLLPPSRRFPSPNPSVEEEEKLHRWSWSWWWWWWWVPGVSLPRNFSSWFIPPVSPRLCFYFFYIFFLFLINHNSPFQFDSEVLKYRPMF